MKVRGMTPSPLTHRFVYMRIGLYMHTCKCTGVHMLQVRVHTCIRTCISGGGDDTVGDPYRDEISQFELFELVLLLKLDNQFSVEQFEATGSQSTVPSPPLTQRNNSSNNNNDYKNGNSSNTNDKHKKYY